MTMFGQIRDSSATDGWQDHAVAVLFVVAVIVGAWVLTRLSRVFFRVLLARVARRALRSGGGQRRPRSPRKLSETRDLAQLRQRHRIDAVAIMLARLAGVVIWLTALVLVLHHFDVNIAFAVSSAGFVGLIVALGAQQSVQDYITGIHVLLEDRYSIGDDIEATTPSGQRVRGVVARFGAFSTQLQVDNVNWHLSNRTMVEIANHSQRGVAVSFEFPVPVDASADEIASSERGRCSFRTGRLLQSRSSTASKSLPARTSTRGWHGSMSVRPETFRLQNKSHSPTRPAAASRNDRASPWRGVISEDGS